MIMQRLDTYDKMPEGMRRYLSQYGWHFSRKLCECAIKGMRTLNKTTGKKEPLEMTSKETVEDLLKKYNLNIDNCKGYDAVYVWHMAKADYFKSSVVDEAHLALFVKDYLDDPDGYDGVAMTRYLADCIGKGEPIIWSEYI